MRAATVAAIRKRLEAATPGPWYRGSEDERLPGALTVWTGSEELVQVAAAGSAADAELIANAPADIEVLLGELERLQAELNAARAETTEIVHDFAFGRLGEEEGA